jgi:hypothetical protein
LAATCTIHRSQGLTFDYLTFDPTNISKHGLTYTTFSHVILFIYLFRSSTSANDFFFQIGPIVAMEICRFQTMA